MFRTTLTSNVYHNRLEKFLRLGSQSVSLKSKMLFFIFFSSKPKHRLTQENFEVIFKSTNLTISCLIETELKTINFFNPTRRGAFKAHPEQKWQFQQFFWSN